MSQDGVPFCQPVDGGDGHHQSLNRGEINNFIHWARARAGTTNETTHPLRAWVYSEQQELLSQERAGMLRKLTVGYAIGKLLQHLKASVSSYSQEELLRMCCVDNFIVSTSIETGGYDEGWEVVGVGMISPVLSLRVTHKIFDSNTFFAVGDEQELKGRDTETIITKHSPFCCAKLPAQDETGVNDKSICYALGTLLRFIFSGDSLLLIDDSNPQETQDKIRRDFFRSLSISPPEGSNSDNNTETSRPTKSSCMPSQPHPFMSGPISRIVGDLLECDSANNTLPSDTTYESLELAIHDMHLLLLEPNQFLFETGHQLRSVGKLHGRSLEAKALLDGFCRVGSTGQSEAFFVKGFSGSGKTSLVNNALDSAIVASGLFVNKKFEQNSTNQLSLILSAFDDICILMSGGNFNSELLWHQLLSEFGSNLHMLVSILPNVVGLAPSRSLAHSLIEDCKNESEINFFSLCDIIKRFIRAISYPTRPLILFLDDLQWADSVSLGLVHTVLSDKQGASSMFFVGSYRDNEVSESHVIHGFFAWLADFNVPQNTIHLDGMPEDDVNSLVSDSLGMLPRLCQPLSQAVFRKTEGSPFFVQTFLRSLVDKGLLTYSLRERSWVWDIDEVYAQNITANVLDLIADKMAHMTQTGQTALKVASCFGIKVDVFIVKGLSGASQYSSLLTDLNQAVEDGLMDLDFGVDKSYFRFVHDKVREAAYDLISSDDKKRCHFDIGMALLSCFENQLEEVAHDNLLTILCQINHGVPSLLHDKLQRISIAKLNYEAASEAMRCYNYTLAYQLSKTATLLLPDDSWTTNYDLTLKFNFLLSKVAHSCSKIDEAKETLHKIVAHSNSLQTKLDAYAILHSILWNVIIPKDIAELAVTMIDMLKSLGEDLPAEDISAEDSTHWMSLATAKFKEENDASLLRASTTNSKDQIIIMQAYNILVNLLYVAKPKAYPYFVSRWAVRYLENKIYNRYASAVYLNFASILCRDMNSDDFQLGYRIGKLGLRMLNRCDSSIYELPLGYLLYYGNIGIMFEPIQACIAMNKEGYDLGFRVGNTSISSVHKQFLIVRQLHAGTNLCDLKEEIELELKMTERYESFPVLAMKLKIYRNTIMTLIGDQTSLEIDNASDRLVFDQQITYVTSQIISLTYLGYYERVKHMVKKWEQLEGGNESTVLTLRAVYVRFYYGLALIGLERKNSKSRKVKVKAREWLDVVKNAAEYNKWNFQNKVALCLAEKLSLSGDCAAAAVQYDTAITAAQSSSFTHEEGLACELAGMHYQRIGNIEKAVSLFRNAENCYKIWGSMVKTQQMKEKINDVCSIQQKGITNH